MSDAIAFLKNLSYQLWVGLDSVNVPVLGVSFLIFLLTVLFINLILWVVKYIMWNKEGVNPASSGLDNNNNYIYRR